MLIGVSGLAHRPRKRPRRGAVDKWTVRAIARTGPLVVDNASRCPPRGPLPTCPQPATTTIKITSGSNSTAFFWKIQGVTSNTADLQPILNTGRIMKAQEREELLQVL